MRTANCPALIYPACVFLTSLVIRAIPEVLMWPFPVGFDPIVYYVPALLDRWPPITLDVLTWASLYHILQLGVYTFLLHDPVVVVKVLGPVLHAGLALAIYAYSRISLHWGPRKSVLVGLIGTTYFAALGISWMQYRVMLGVVFLLATLCSIKMVDARRRWTLGILFTVLTAFAHELVTFVLIFILCVDVAFRTLRKDLRSSGLEFSLAGLAIFIFVEQRVILPTSSGGLPIGFDVPVSQATLQAQVPGFLLYLYWLMIPLCIIGLTRLRNLELESWLAICLTIPIVTAVISAFGTFTWYRFADLIVYPATFFVVEGADRLAKAGSNLRFRIPTGKIVAGAYLILLLIPSGFYLTASPEQPFPYFSQYNPYLIYFPSSMLQNSLSLRDASATMLVLDWFNTNCPRDSVVIATEPFIGFAKLARLDEHCVATRHLVAPTVADLQRGNDPDFITQEFVTEVEVLRSEGYAHVYTIWWVRGIGWYNVRSLPGFFHEVYRVETIAVYEAVSLS
jgi:hypothetical protein